MQGANWIIGVLWAIAASKQFLQCRVAFGAADQRSHLCVQCVAWTGMPAPERENHQAQRAAQPAIGEVVEQAVQGFLCQAQAFLQGPAQ
ncbi:hypothetical protein D3C80_2082420 [compost metagenome]